MRATAVTRAADVVLPVAPTAEKSGTFVTWEGRPRPVEKVLADSHALPDLRVLAGIADELGVDLGLGLVEQARAELAELGPWDGARADFVTPDSERAASEPAAAHAAPRGSAAPAGDELVLATWKQMVDDGTMLDGDAYLRATGRAALVLVSQRTLAGLGVAAGANVTVSGPRGSVTLPVAVADLADDVVWLPSNSDGVNVNRDLGARACTAVRVKGGAA